jgi:hypothetical protein
MSVKAHMMRLIMESQKGAAPEDEHHREVAGFEIPRQRRWVNMDKLIEKRWKTNKRSKRCGFSPGTQWRSRMVRRRSDTATNEGFHR